MILGAFVLRLNVIKAGAIPVSHGRLVHAAFLDIVRQLNVSLSEDLHNDKIKRFSVGMLAADENKLCQGMLRFSVRDTAVWRVCSLSDIVTQTCLEIKSGITVRIGNVVFQVEQVYMDPQEHAASMVITTGDLLEKARELADSKYIEMNFVTPASFRYFDKDYAFPRPDLIFRALAERWNVMETDYGFETEKVREVAGLHVIPVNWKGETRRVNLTAEYGVTGFVGKFIFSMKTLPANYRKIFITLALFAMFSGIGRLTAQGMGVVSVTVR